MDLLTSVLEGETQAPRIGAGATTRFGHLQIEHTTHLALWMGVGLLVAPIAENHTPTTNADVVWVGRKVQESSVLIVKSSKVG